MLQLRLAATTVALAFCGVAAAQTGEDSQPVTDHFQPVTDRMLQNPDPADWLSWRRTLDGWAYSPLDGINKENVAQLKEVWSQPGGSGNQEATPLVYRGVMYVPNRGDYVQAFMRGPASACGSTSDNLPREPRARRTVPSRSGARR